MEEKTNINDFNWKGLEPSTVTWAAKLMEVYIFDVGELELLRRACEMRDIADASQVALKRDGEYIYPAADPGNPKPHPGLRVHGQAVERQKAILKQLGVGA